jgi:hypothetical protein
MPHLRVRGLSEEEVKEITVGIAEKLAELTSLPEDVFGIELIESKYFFKGKESEASPPLFEVLWFDRGQEIQDGAAQIIFEIMRQLNYDDVRISFINLEKNRYYKNGKHY